RTRSQRSALLPAGLPSRSAAKSSEGHDATPQPAGQSGRLEVREANQNIVAAGNGQDLALRHFVERQRKWDLFLTEKRRCTDGKKREHGQRHQSIQKAARAHIVSPQKSTVAVTTSV